VKSKPDIAILYHIFYEDSAEMVCRELQPLCVHNPVFLFNICADTPDKTAMSGILKAAFPGSYIISTSNKGKDIGGKLALIQLLLELEMEPDYLLLLHDKKSLQALNSNTWKDGLLKIISPESVAIIPEMFRRNQPVGIVCTKEYMISERYENGHFLGVNGPVLEKFLSEYDIKPPSFAFVAGTMFWARAKPIIDFFKIYSPVAIRQRLENGNVIDNFSGTITHSWERLLTWMVTSRGYHIKGI
jgi:lipopolysaccharide biosynthesis protein